MNCNVTLTAKEFSEIHNILWHLEFNSMDAVTGAQKIREALANAYEQDSMAFETKMDYFDRVREELGLTATWSMYEVDDLSQRHPFEGATKVVYSAFGSGDQEVAINGSTWAALYVAGNALIRDSGDNHHVFIEHFKQSSVNPEILFMTTGS